MSNTIHGRMYEVKAPHIHSEYDRRKASTRIHVEGLNKVDGSPIRFKSVERASNHIRNMRLERE